MVRLSVAVVGLYLLCIGYAYASSRRPSSSKHEKVFHPKKPPMIQRMAIASAEFGTEVASSAATYEAGSHCLRGAKKAADGDLHGAVADCATAGALSCVSHGFKGAKKFIVDYKEDKKREAEALAEKQEKELRYFKYGRTKPNRTLD